MYVILEFSSINIYDELTLSSNFVKFDTRTIEKDLNIKVSAKNELRGS